MEEFMNQKRLSYLTNLLLILVIPALLLLNRAEATPVLAGTDYWKLNENDGTVGLTLGSYGNILFENNFVGSSPNTSQWYSGEFYANRGCGQRGL